MNRVQACRVCCNGALGFRELLDFISACCFPGHCGGVRWL